MIEARYVDIKKVSEYKKTLMGIAILLIIMFHYGAIYSYYDTNTNIISFITGKIVGAIGVDIFAFLSGIGVFFSLNKNSIKRYYKNRMQRILPTYLIIGGIFWIIKDLIVLNASIWVFIKDLSLMSFWTEGENRFWYIAYICLMYLIAPLLLRSNKQNKRQFEFLVGGGTALVIVIISLLYILFPEIYSNTEIALKRIPIFVFGTLFGSWIIDGKKVSRKVICSVGIIGFILYGVSKATPYDLIDRYGLSILSVFTCVALPYVLQRIIDNDFLSILNYAGELSLELYLSHVALIWACIYFKIWLPNIVVYTAMIVVAIIFSVCVHHMIKKPLKEHNSRTL